MPLTPHTLPKKYAPPPPYTHAPPIYTLYLIIIFIYFPILMTKIVFIFPLRRLGGKQIHHKSCLKL